MNKILTFAWKELYTTFRDRNLILIMFLTPILLSTIMGLAFGGLGGDDSSAFTNIPIAIVNLDEGFNLGDQLPEGTDPSQLSLSELEFELGGEMINVGELFLQNENLDLQDTDLNGGNASFNFGEQLVSILLSEEVTDTETSTGTVGFNFDDLSCPLIEEETESETESETETDDNESDNPLGFDMTLAELFDAVEVADPAEARAGVEQGDYVAAVIIPASFSNDLSPTFGFTEERADVSGTSAVEIYANNGQSIKASIARAVVEGIVNQLVRVSVAIDSVLLTAFDTLSNQLLAGQLNLATIDPSLVTDGFQGLDSSVIEPLGCLLLPEAGNIQLKRQPLDETQAGSSFAFIMVILGSSQAIFFALFTGIFGMNSIYEERKNWTLQRLVAAPMPRVYILFGKLLGNVVVVAAQLIVLFLAFTVITSLVEGEPTFIWGTNGFLLAVVILAVSLFVSGVGVLIVGLAGTPEQVQTFGPIVAAGLGALGGSFGFRLPPEVARISPVWWGTEALKLLSQGDWGIGVHLLVLFGAGSGLFVVGAFLFKRRLQL